MTSRYRTLLLAAGLTCVIGGAAAWAYAESWTGRAEDGVAQPLWLLAGQQSRAEAYLDDLDREDLLRVLLVSEDAGCGGVVMDALTPVVADAEALPPLRVLRGIAARTPRDADPMTAAPLGHDLTTALASERDEAIAMEAELYVGDVLRSGAAIVVGDPLTQAMGLSGDLLDLDGPRLRRIIRWIDPRRDARAPLTRAAAQPGTLAESFAATVGVGGVSVARVDTSEVLGSVQWRGRLSRDLSDSVFQVSSSAADWAYAEAIYTADPEATLDSLRATEALTTDVLRALLLPLTTYRFATRHMGAEHLGELVPRSEGSPRAPEATVRAGVSLPTQQSDAPHLGDARDTALYRLRIRRNSAKLLRGDSAALPWAVRLDTFLVVNGSGYRASELNSGLGVYGPTRWVSAEAAGVDSLAQAYGRAVVLVGPAEDSVAPRPGYVQASDDIAVVYVVVGAVPALDTIGLRTHVLHQPSADLTDWRNLYAAVFGGHPLRAGPNATRLALLDAHTADIDVVQLTDIDVAMREAIKAGAFPGGQVSVVYRGQLVYDKGFGHLAPGERGVDPTDLYDLASLTKVTSTTLAVMRLYERGQIELEAPLSRYLEGLSAATGALRVRQLLRHRSGLPPSMPIYAELKATKRAYHRVDCGAKYCAEASGAFSVPVANRVYYRAADRNAFYAAAKQLEPKGTTRYSDLNFFFLQQIVERVTGQPIDAYVREQFYEPLGLALTYRPLARYGRRATLLRTAPTEYDHKWRRQRLRGHVHDEAAALQGGVGGHAGVFGSARDLAVLFAMLGDGGVYGGIRYFEPATIAKFTETTAGVRRGLGFAKAPRPDESKEDVLPVFGHTGFTGTSVWTDPEAGITVAFTSNRIYRGRSNWRIQKMQVREQVSRIVYNALADDPRGANEMAFAKTQTPAL